MTTTIVVLSVLVHFALAIQSVRRAQATRHDRLALEAVKRDLVAAELSEFKRRPVCCEHASCVAGRR